MSTPVQQQQQELSLVDYLRPVFSRWWLVLFIVITTTVATYVFYDRQEKVFSTSTRLYTETNDSTNFVLGAFQASPSPRAIQNQATLLTTGVFRARVERQLGRPPAGVVAVADATSDFITITSTGSDPQLVADTANAYADVYIEVRSERSQSALKQGLEKSQQQLEALPRSQNNAAERSELAAAVRRIKLALELPTGGTTQLDRAGVPGVALSPRPRRNAVFAFALSLVAALALAFGLERFDRRLKRVEDAEQMYGTSLLAVVPHAKVASGFDGEAAVISHDFHEAFRQLRTNLQLSALERPLRRILITSAVPGEGKSTVARNLAIAFREFGRSVVVVDADLRRPVQAELFRVSTADGFTSVLTGDITLDDALVDVPVAAAGLDALARVEAAASGATSSHDAGSGVAVLAAGGAAANPQAILSSRRTDEILEELQQRFDLVIIDTPPVSVVADALALAGDSDAVVLVSRIGQSTSDGARRAQAALARVPRANVVGVVVNDLATGIGAGAYDYGYAYRASVTV